MIKIVKDVASLLISETQKVVRVCQRHALSISQMLFTKSASLSFLSMVLLGAIYGHTKFDPYHRDLFLKAQIYQIVTAGGMLACSFFHKPSILVKLAYTGFVGGTVLFSGMLYLKAVRPDLQEQLKAFNVLVPTGGLLMIGGFLSLLMA